MFDVGFSELLFLGIIVIVVLGPERLPDAIRFALKGIQKISQIKSDLKEKLDLELELHQLRDELKGEIQQVKQLELQMHHYFASIEQQITEDLKRYYPIQSYTIPIPYQSQFVITHLVHWPCLDAKSIGVHHV